MGGAVCQGLFQLFSPGGAEQSSEAAHTKHKELAQCTSPHAHTTHTQLLKVPMKIILLASLKEFVLEQRNRHHPNTRWLAGTTQEHTDSHASIIQHLNHTCRPTGCTQAVLLSS